MDPKKDLNVTRRDLLKSATVAISSFALANLDSGNESLCSPVDARTSNRPSTKHDTVVGMKFAARDAVRVGIVGVGGRGKSLLRDLLAIENVQITAICDTAKEKALSAQSAVEKSGQKPPALYHSHERAFENLCKREDIDLVYVATPWSWHVPMALTALNNGKHAAVEVPAATTLKECWDLVEASEKTRRHCVMLENCCYGYNEMMVLNMVRDGVFGEITHGEAAYIHNLRQILFSNDGEGLWRRFDHLKRDGNLYPTHGLGPVANYMNINRGDRFEYLVSMSSPQVGLTAYRAKHVPAGDPRWKETYRCGDMNTSLIKTAKGRTIMLQHDVTSPRPYDRINLISGTRGTFRDYPPRIYIDEQEGGEQWTTVDKYKTQYEHPLWKKAGELARKLGGHGGMDFIMNYRLIQCMREGLVPDMDVYDAAAWSAPSPLSEMSVAHGSAPATFPDFTGGRWKEVR